MNTITNIKLPHQLSFLYLIYVAYGPFYLFIFFLPLSLINSIQQATLFLGRMLSQIRKISKEISSNYAQQPRGLTKQISKSILDKYLHEDYPCLDAMERLMYRIIPYWNISAQRMRKNVTGIVEATWEFDYITQNTPIVVADKNLTNSLMQEINDDSIAGKNISVYLVFWLPLSTMLLAHVLHNEPNQENKFGVLTTGLIMLVAMLLISFALYVYSNVLASPFNLYLQHLCPSSYIAILDFVFTIICAASPTILLIPMTILYGCATSWLHFRLYNQALKPTLLEMVALFCMVTFLHACAAYFYYVNFSWFWTHQPTPPTTPESHQLILRHYQETPPHL